MRVRHRLLLVLMAASTAGALLVAAGAAALVRQAVRERFVERIRAETALIAEWAAAETAPDPQEIAARAAARLGVRVTLIRTDGIVLGDSAKDRTTVQTMDNHIDRPEVRAARLRGTGESFRRSATTNREYFYSARSVEPVGSVKYIRIALPSSEVHRVQARYVGLVLVVLLGTMVVLTGIGYWAVRGLSRPVEEMALAVERSAAGDLNLELPRSGGHEVARLGRAVEQLQQATLEKVRELDAERGVLISVISGMREGLLLVGSDRHARLVNDALSKVLDLSTDPTGLPMEEVVRHPALLRDVEQALAEGKEITESVVHLPASGRSFQVQITPLKRPGEEAVEAVLLLLFDITRLETLEGIRREFVANVSHELRTPLTSIIASVETLIEGGVDDETQAKRFLEIIRKHADRMGDLIEDLTDLSLIETGAIQLEFEQVDAAEVAREVVDQIQPLARGREVDVSVELGSPFPISADRRRLEQIVTNLVDNAVKFSKPGGTVSIRGSRNGEGARLSVEDDGIGIPSDSLEKVFHRFHQVSRGRSKEVGGTGLGLAIVKHLMRLHGGRVTVESELGQGSTFTLVFPA